MGNTYTLPSGYNAKDVCSELNKIFIGQTWPSIPYRCEAIGDNKICMYSIKQKYSYK